MRRAFLTGGTGFLGRHLIERLMADGWHVTALHRSESPPDWFAQDSVTPVRGDITDADSVRAAMPDGVDAVLHAAADTSPWRGHRARQERVNIGGTQTVLEAARAAGAKRVVHVSSIAVWGHQDGMIDETSPRLAAHSRIGYLRTKALAETRVEAAIAGGQDAVIVNPAHIIGRYDTANWARMIRLIDRDALPGVPPGAGCFANAAAVAEAVIAAVDKGRTGERYILGGPQARFLEMVRIIARLLDKPEPRRTVPAALLFAVGWLGNMRGWLTGREPELTPEAADFVCHRLDCRSDKAMAELGYRIVPLADSLTESVAWLRTEGLIGG